MQNPTAEKPRTGTEVGVPLPWVPPLPLIDRALLDLTSRRLVAEAVVLRLQGVPELLTEADMEGAAYYADRLRNLCAGIATAAADASSGMAP